MHISSSYAEILGEKLFRTWEIPRSGSKAKDGGGKKKRRERLNDGNNNGQATQSMAPVSRLGQLPPYISIMYNALYNVTTLPLLPLLCTLHTFSVVSETIILGILSDK